MSYRNDHDAALARVDALEAQNHALAAENEKLRGGGTLDTPQAERNTPRAAIAVATVAGLAVAAVIGVFATSSKAAPMPPSPAHRIVEPTLTADEPPVHFDKKALEQCASKLVLVPNADAVTMDPHRGGHGVEHVLSSTGCRIEIHDVLDTAILSRNERAALDGWNDAELQLENVVAMVGEYYRTDPYLLDDYSTAPQLWREYNRALDIRNEALKEWRDAAR